VRILFVTDTYFPDVNGTAIFVYRLAQMMARAGNEVYVAAPSRKFGHERYTHESSGVTVFGVPSSSVFNYAYFRAPTMLFSKKKLEKFMREINPDVVHLQQHFVIGREARKIARKLGIPTIGTNHFLPENLVHFMPKIMHKPLSAIGFNQLLAVYGDLHVVTTPTATAARVIEEIGFTTKIVPVSNGIDLKRFNPRNSGQYLFKKYGIPRKKTILFVGRQDKEKRVDLLIRALVVVREKVDAQLVLVGPGTNKFLLKMLVKKLGLEKHVIFTGFIEDEDLPNIYKVGDVFANAGIAELQCIAAMEALASGLPLVASDYKALPELVESGKNGYLFHDDYRDLAVHLTKILSDDKLRASMSKKSLEIISKHSFEKTIETYTALYKKTIELNKNGEMLAVKKNAIVAITGPFFSWIVLIFAAFEVATQPILKLQKNISLARSTSKD
jgi:glycosyltransferase involved in cell wall biosynthesis